MTQERPIYISYYTIDTPYEEEVKKLAASLIQFELPHELWGLPSLGSWAKNVSQISNVCREAVDKYPDRPVVFICADCIIRQRPELLEKMPSDIDFAVHYGLYHKRIGRQVNGSCYYFAPTDEAKILVREYERRCMVELAANDFPRWEEKVMQEIIDEGKWKGKWLNLPGTYSKIFDNEIQDGANEPPVIELFQASRRFRGLIK